MTSTESTDEWRACIADRLASLRGRMSLRAVAEHLRVVPNTVRNWEDPKNVGSLPRIDQIGELQTLYGNFSVDWLLRPAPIAPGDESETWIVDGELVRQKRASLSVDDACWSFAAWAQLHAGSRVERSRSELEKLDDELKEKLGHLERRTRRE